MELIGTTVGIYKIVGPAPSKNGKRYYLRCECGVEIIKTATTIRRGITSRHRGCKLYIPKMTVAERSKRYDESFDKSGPRVVEASPESIIDRLDYEIVHGCHEYTGTISSTGYGVMGVLTNHGYKNLYAHRLAYDYLVGPTNGLHVCHKCDNTMCINPDHLFLGTDADNQKDKVDKGRQMSGEDHTNSILTEQAVRQLRSGEKTTRQIADEFGVSISYCRDVKAGRYWKHI